MKTILLMLATAALAAAPLAAQAGDAERGRAAATQYTCVSCHGADLKSPIDPSYPKLAGQQADYLVQSLKAYRHPDNKTYGRDQAVMKSMAAPLTEQDIEDIAAYAASLPGGLVTER